MRPPARAAWGLLFLALCPFIACGQRLQLACAAVEAGRCWPSQHGGSIDGSNALRGGARLVAQAVPGACFACPFPHIVHTVPYAAVEVTLSLTAREWNWPLTCIAPRLVRVSGAGTTGACVRT